MHCSTHAASACNSLVQTLPQLSGLRQASRLHYFLACANVTHQSSGLKASTAMAEDPGSLFLRGWLWQVQGPSSQLPVSHPPGGDTQLHGTRAVQCQVGACSHRLEGPSRWTISLTPMQAVSTPLRPMLKWLEAPVTTARASQFPSLSRAAKQAMWCCGD